MGALSSPFFLEPASLTHLGFSAPVHTREVVWQYSIAQSAIISKGRRVKAQIADLTIEPDQVHIWLAAPLEIVDPNLLEGYLELLNDDERRRQARFVFPKHRHLYLVSHTLVRTILSRYANVHPRDWTFEKNDFGRPDAILPPKSPPIKLNLSHTDELAVCAVALDRELGVDVENLTRRSEAVKLAENYFSSAEVYDLQQLPKSEQRGRFFDLWTLKESYMKARGVGLSLGLGNFSFSLTTNNIDVRFSPAIRDDPSQWQFSIFDPTAKHRVALAVRRGSGPDLKLRVRKSVPLLKDEELSCC
jgi:4'-phosphopantetheinyl transferase